MKSTLLKMNNRIYIIGALCLLVTSIFSIGYYQFDEHFQILEFAGLKLGITPESNMAWEYYYQMRPTLQPTLVYIIYKAFGIVGVDNPFFISFFLRFLTALLSFYCIHLLVKVYKERIDDKNLKKWFIILSFTLWFLIFVSVRFSSETWSSLMFILGFTYYSLIDKRNNYLFIRLGLLFGFSFLFRYQASLLIFGFGLWLLFIKKEKLVSLISLISGFLIIVLLGILIDRWFYGEWTITTWNYFNQNIIEDKASGFGVEPWWFYFTKTLVSAVPPISILIITSFITLIFYRPKNPLVWIMIPFILVHSIIGHKEIRFLFSLSYFVPILIIKGIEVIQNQFILNLSEKIYMKWIMRLVFFTNIGMLLVVMFKPADSQISLYQEIYSSYKEPTTLYYINSNPYDRVLDIYFYKRKNLTIKKVESLNYIPADGNNLIVFNKRDKSDNSRIGDLVYSTFPDYVLKFNFNNWQDRAYAWYVYEIN